MLKCSLIFSRFSMKGMEYEQKSRRRSKRVKSIDELEDHVLPCEVREPEFRARYGLVDIVRNMPPYDVFRSVEMLDETLLCVHDLVFNDMVYSLTFRACDEGEMQIIPILDRMLRSLGRFTRPLPRMEVEQTYGQDRSSKKADFAIKYEAEEDTDPAVEEHSEDMTPKPYASASASRLHAKLYVYSKRYTMFGLRLKAIVDWKAKAGINNLFQPAMYSIREMQDPVMVPRPKSYRPPVYVFACDKCYWYYGILEIDGFVKVVNQEISLALLSEEAENLKKFTPSFTRAEVLEKMNTWKQTLALQGMRVPNGLHPVGRFFVRAVQGYEMLTVGDLGDGQRRFINGLLKILVGRRVNKWKPEDATEAWNARKYLETHRK